MSRVMESLREKNKLLTPHQAHHHDQEFATWTFRSQAKWSFNALQRVVEHLPQGIFRAKGMVQLDLETDDYGILQVTGRRGWLRLNPKRTGPSPPNWCSSASLALQAIKTLKFTLNRRGRLPTPKEKKATL
jgi:hypothetical protein